MIFACIVEGSTETQNPDTNTEDDNNSEDQIPEEGVDGETTDSEQDLDQDTAEEDPDADTTVEEPVAEEPEEPAEDADSELKASGAALNKAAPVSEVSITVENWEKDGTVKEDGSKADKQLSKGDIAEITFLDGTNAAGDKTLGGERAVQFRIDDEKAGWKTETFKVTYSIPSEIESEKKENAEPTFANDVYTIPANTKVTTGEGDAAKTVKAYSGNITIKITAEPVKSTLKLSEAKDGVTVNLVKEGAVDAEAAIDTTGKTLTYAESQSKVTVAATGTDYLKGKYHTIQVQVGENTSKQSIPGEKRTVGTDSDAKDYVFFSFNPGEIGGLKENEDTDITITLDDAGTAKTLALAIADDQGESGSWKIGKKEVTKAETDKNTYITVNESGAFADADDLTEDNLSTTEEGVTSKKILAFTVEPTTSYKLSGTNPVTAELTKKGDKEVVKTLMATAVPKTGEGATGVDYYTIDLSEITAADFKGEEMTLTVKAATEYDTSKLGENGVHEISFAVENADVLDAKGESIGSSKIIDEKTLTFGILPDDGYSIKKGTSYVDSNTDKEVADFSYTKRYVLTIADNSKDTYKEAYPDGKIVVTVPAEEEEVILTDQTISDKTVKGYEFKFEDAAYTDDEWKTADGKVVGTSVSADAITSTEGKCAYTLEAVTVTVETELETTEGGTVTVVSNDADYEISGEGISKKSGDVWTISEEATLLTLTIASDVEPSITYSADGKAAVKGEAGSYTAVIPVNLFAKDANDKIDDTITIKKDARDLTVQQKVDGSEDAEGFSGQIEINGKAVEINADTNKVNESLVNGEQIEVTLTAPVGTEFVKVTTQAGNAAAETVELQENKSAVTFERTMTADMTVTAELKSIYEATLEVDGEAYTKADMDASGAYVIPYGSENIKVSLFHGDAKVDENAADILYAKVYDDNETAATQATMASDKKSVSIKSIHEQDTGVLRIDLAAVATKKVAASVSIKQEKAATAVTITDGKKAVTAATLMADSKVEYTVAASGAGRLDYANVGVEVVDSAEAGVPAAGAAVNTSVAAEYDKGTLTITALPALKGSDKKPVAYVRLFDQDARTKNASVADADKICQLAAPIPVTITDPSIIGQKATVKEATGSNKVLRLELSTSDKIVKPLNDKNAVYYQIVIDGEVSANVEKIQYIEKTNYEKVNTQLAEIVVDTDAASEGSAKPYTVTVQLVQTTAGKDAKTELTENTLILAGDNAITTTKTATRDPLYETKLKMKPASATVSTGQPLTVVTQAQFDKKTGYTVVPYVQFINTKTGVLQGKASNEENQNGIATSDSWSAKVDANGNVSIGNTLSQSSTLPKDLGLKVTAFYPDGAYASTAIVKITTVRGIHNIDFVSGTNRTLYKKSGAAASLKLTPVLNDGVKEYAPKKKNLTFAMGDAEGNLPGEVGYTANAYLAGKVDVSPKNGAVSIKDKNFTASSNKDENRFTVVAMAADYTGNYQNNGRRVAVKVEITGTPQTFTNVAIVQTVKGQDGSVTGYKAVAGNGILKAEDFLAGDLYLRAVKNNVNKRVYSEEDFVDGVTYTSGAKGVVAVDTADGKLTFVKPQAKAIKLTVAAADGGPKLSVSKEVTVQGYDKIGLKIVGSEGSNSDPDDDDVEYDGPMTARFTVEPRVWANGEWQPTSYTNMTIKVKGAKVVEKPKNGVSYNIIVMSAAEATVTIADKAVKGSDKIYTIKQVPPTDLKAKASAIKQIGKLTADDVAKAQTSDDVKVTFQVTNKDTKNDARKYVFLTPDYTKKATDYDNAWRYFLDGSETKIVQIDDNGKFELTLNLKGKKTYEILPGSYTLIANVGEYGEDGKFVPAAKGVTLKIAIPGKAAKDSLSVKGKYTLDASATTAISLASNKNIVTDYDWMLTNEADKDGNYALNKIDPKTGKANEFNKYFEIKKVTDADGKADYVLSLKKDVDFAKIAGKDGAADREGYVTVTSYRRNGSGKTYLQTKDMKISVTITDKTKLVAKTVENSVYAAAPTVATVKIYENAKSPEEDALAIAGAVVVPDEKNGGATLPETNSVANGKELKISFANAIAGTYKVNLKVLLADSAYANSTIEGFATAEAKAKEFGRDVSVTIKVSGTDDKTKNKTTADTKKALTYDRYDAATKKYTITVPVESAIEGAAINGSDAAFGIPAQDNKGKDLAVKKFITATYKDGDLTFVIDRTEMLAQAAAKAVTLGKAADVPVNFTFTNSVAAEKVSYKIMLPNPMTLAQWQDTKNKKAQSQFALEAALTGMNADKLGSADDEELKADLKERIEAAIKAAVPEDIQADPVTREVTLEDVKDADNVVTGYKTTITIQASAEEKYTYEFKCDKTVETGSSEVEAIKDAIESITKNDLVQLDNQYDDDKLLVDVKAALKEADVKIPVNIRLSVSKWYLKRATEKVGGKFSATISIRDRNNVSDPETAEVGGENKVFDIEMLKNLSDTAKAVGEALANYDDSTKKGVDYTDVILKALDGKSNLNDVETALANVIKAEAEKAIVNKSITVGDFVKIEKASDEGASDNPATTETDGKVMVDVDFKLPTAENAGSVSFKLNLEQEGMKPLAVDKKTTSITIPKNDKFQTLTEAETEVKKLGSDSNNVLTLSDSIYEETTDGVKKAVEDLVKPVVKSANVTFTVTCTGFKDGETPADGPSAEKPVTAEGVITLTDGLNRAAETADNTIEISYSVTIPKYEKSFEAITIKAVDGDGKDVTLTGEALEVANATLKDGGKWVFRADFGTSKWLSATDKVVTWTRVEKTTADNGGKLSEIPTVTTAIEGVTVAFDAASSTATITVTDKSKITADTKIILRGVSALNGQKLTESGSEIDEEKAVKFVTVTLKAPETEEP